MGRIVSNERHAVRDRDGTYQEIDQRDDGPALEEFRSEPPGDAGAVHVEIDHGGFVAKDLLNGIEPGGRDVKPIGQNVEFGQGIGPRSVPGKSSWFGSSLMTAPFRAGGAILIRRSWPSRPFGTQFRRRQRESFTS